LVPRQIGKQAGAVLSLYSDTVDEAKLEDKIPVIAIKQKNTRGWLIGIDPKYLNDAISKLNELWTKKRF
jgi:hypothetical protein